MSWKSDRRLTAIWGSPEVGAADVSRDLVRPGRTSEFEHDGHFMIIADSKPVGHVQLGTLDSSRHLTTDLSVVMADIDGQSHVRALDAVAALSAFLFQGRRTHRIEMIVPNASPWTQRLREQLGFETEGVLRDSALIDGGYRDEELLALMEPTVRER
jgi:RimJ/RimL family protein N-acetyltransferase